MSAWVLVIFLKYGYAGGVVAIDMPDANSCQAALMKAAKENTYMDGFCVARKS